MSTSNNAAPATVEVVLLKDHTHGGQQLAKGTKIRVSAHQREFLIARDIIAKSSPQLAVATADKAKG